jgi:serine/threonine-protein kinase HipA
MTSDPQFAFVWVWLPETATPVVAGRLDVVGPLLTFTYGRSYLLRDDAIPLYLPELPLERGRIPPRVGDVAGCIADAGPDSWGQRVILNRLVGTETDDTTALTPLTYLLESGSDRIGALDFQASATEYVPRLANEATLDELLESAERVQQGIPLTPALDQALFHGSSLGGARPKAGLADGNRRLIAKFSASGDTYSVVKGEFVAMRLASLVGLDVAPVALAKASARDVLLVERFDRTAAGHRRAMVSALTILELDAYPGGRYATYAGLAREIRARFTRPRDTLRELFARIVFNILTGNTDDHARNHAAFWDGRELTLTPAYDICPQSRSGETATQVMAIGEDDYNRSQLAGCVRRAATYLLSAQEARDLIDHQIETITSQWDRVCDEAELTEVDRAYFWHRQFLNPYATEGYR